MTDAASRPAAAAGACAALLLAGLVAYGPHEGGDTTRYVAYGRELWHALANVQLPDLPASAALYLAPSLVIGAASIAFGEGFALACVLLNIALFSCLAACLFAVWGRAWDEPPGVVAIVGGLFLLLGNPDVVVWNYFVLSDVMFLFLVAALWYGVALAMTTGARAAWWGAALIAAAALVCRPTAPPLVASLLGAILLWRASEGRGHGRTLVALGVIPALGALLLWPVLVYLAAAEGTAAGSLVPDLLLGHYQAGTVIVDRPETAHVAPRGYVDFVAITLDRFASFYIPLRRGYSVAHNVLVGAYALGFGLALWSGWRRLASRWPALAEAAALSALYFGLFHAMVVVDFDWRYQLPAMVPLWLVAGYGLPAQLSSPDEA